MGNILTIPDKIKVGFDYRDDTYNGKLAYIIYYDNKGVLRKQTSWDNWRDESITAEDYQNEPIEGFVLNKQVGGHKSGWNFRQSYSRVYDPRGFEFEITMENLLFILQERDCYKGKGLEGEFVYAWSGKDLVLLPTSCDDYKESKIVKNNTKKISLKDIKPGELYQSKKFTDLLYLGKLDWNYYNKGKWIIEPQHVFYNIKNDNDFTYSDTRFLVVRNANRLLFCKDENYSLNDILDKYYKSFRGGYHLIDKVNMFSVKESPKWDEETEMEDMKKWYLNWNDVEFNIIIDNKLYHCSIFKPNSAYNKNKSDYEISYHKIRGMNGEVIEENNYRYAKNQPSMIPIMEKNNIPCTQEDIIRLFNHYLRYKTEVHINLINGGSFHEQHIITYSNWD